MSFLHWLNVQAAATATTVTNVASNSPEPARNVVVYTAALIVVTTAIITIFRKFAK